MVCPFYVHVTVLRGDFPLIAMRAIPDSTNASQRSSFYKGFSGISGPWKLIKLVRWGKPETVFQEFPAILRRLDCPKLVIHGSRDILPESFAMPSR